MTRMVAAQATAERTAVAARHFAAAGEAHQYLTFQLRGEMYAVGILNIKEIIEYGRLTGIPMMPAFVRGVINLRGAVVPVVDLAARFGHAQSGIGKRSCIVIVEVGQGEDSQDLGIMVDAVSEVIEIPRGEIEPPPSFGARIRAEFIAGMGKVAGRFVILLDIQRVLSSEEMALLSGVGGAAAAEGATAGSR